MSFIRYQIYSTSSTFRIVSQLICYSFFIVRGHHTHRHYQHLSSIAFSWTGLVPYVSGETTFRRESKSPSVSQVFIYNPPLIGKVGILYHYQSERKQIIIWTILQNVLMNKENLFLLTILQLCSS